MGKKVSTGNRGEPSQEWLEYQNDINGSMAEVQVKSLFWIKGQALIQTRRDLTKNLWFLRDSFSVETRNQEFWSAPKKANTLICMPYFVFQTKKHVTAGNYNFDLA